MKKLYTIIAILAAMVGGAAYWVFFRKKGAAAVKVIQELQTPSQIVGRAKGIADALGTGWFYRPTENDEDAAKLISQVSGPNWEATKKSYKFLFQKNLKDDATRLIDTDIKLDYAIFLNPKGIY